MHDDWVEIVDVFEEVTNIYQVDKESKIIKAIEITQYEINII